MLKDDFIDIALDEIEFDADDDDDARIVKIENAMNLFRQEHGAFEDDEPGAATDIIKTETPEEDASSQKKQIDVWTKAGGTLPDPKKLTEYYGQGIKNLIANPFETLFPIANAMSNPEDPEALRLAKTNIGGLIDVLSSLDRGIDFATGGVFTAGKKAAKKIVPGEGIVSETAKGLIDVATDPTTYIGVGTVKKMMEDPVEAAIKKAGKQVSQPIKKTVAQISRLDKALVQRTATDPEYLKRLKQAAIDEGVGGFDELIESVKKKVNSINMETKVAARNKIKDVNELLDSQIKNNIKINDDNIKSALDVSLDEITPSVRGISIEDAAKKSRGAAGETFGSAQTEYLDEAVKLKRTQSGNVVEKEIGNILKEAGYDGKVYRAVEKFDNSPALKADIIDAESFMELAGKAETLGDALNQLRTIRKLKGSPKPDGSFYNSVMLGKIDSAYQNIIEDHLSDYGDEFVSMWKANNERYKTAINVINNVNKGLSIGRVGPENYIGKIKKLGIDNLLDIKTVAAIDENVAPIWKELQGGFVDDVVLRSLDNNGIINFQKLKNNLTKIDSIDPELKTIMLGKNKADNIVSAIQQYDSAIESNKILAEQTKNLVKRIESTKGTIGENLTKTAAFSRIKNIGSKTSVATEAKETLKILDEFYDTDFARRAEDFWNAKQLKISPEGDFPFLPTELTGRSLLGLAIVKSLKFIDKVPIAGPFMSTVLGLTGQSPAGAIAIFKGLDSIARLKNATIKKSPMLATGAALSTRTAASNELPSRQAIRTGIGR